LEGKGKEKEEYKEGRREVGRIIGAGAGGDKQAG
jgi:hypothetical protein